MTSESVIGDVSKVVIGNERIYVLSLIDPRIFIFSLDGKYINSLKRGNGPGEVLLSIVFITIEQPKLIRNIRV